MSPAQNNDLVSAAFGSASSPVTPMPQSDIHHPLQSRKSVLAPIQQQSTRILQQNRLASNFKRDKNIIIYVLIL